MKHYVLAAVFSSITLAMFNPVWAGNTIPCPDLSEAMQIGDCPIEDDLRHMFNKGCGVERDPTAKKPELCDSYAEFKRRKNT
ncbi:MAG: hypothetical protein OQL16_05120, partial [Gammaproteobacteria bacterium]|nr:hypothetical protein [Gammaproteobacteria bacterium]